MDEEWLAKNTTKGTSIGAVVDGSAASDKALALAGAFWDPKRGDSYTMMHVCDSSKKDLARNLQPQNVKSNAEHKAYELKVGGAELSVSAL
jgi:hypothetical protein